MSETDTPHEEGHAGTSAPAGDRRSPGISGLHGLERVARGLGDLWARPRTRSATVGLLLIALGVWVVQNSAFTFPLLLVGVVMVAVAWVGSRLEGHFAVEWSEAGAGFEMRARFKSAAAPLTTVVRALPSPTIGEPVIEGEAHTVEIDVEELRALVAAAEQGPRVTTTAGVPVSWQETSADGNHSDPIA